MDIGQKHNIKIPNAVIVTGIAGNEQDEEIVDFLKQYGSINRIITADDCSSEFFQNLIIEYNTGIAVKTLEPLLPCIHVADDNGITYHVQSFKHRQWGIPQLSHILLNLKGFLN